MQSESSQLSQLSFDGFNLPLSSQELNGLLNINSQDVLDIDCLSQETTEVEREGGDEREITDVIMNSDEDLMDRAEASIPTGFQCNQCPKTYKERKYLNRHIKSTHEGRTFACGICARDFTLSGNRNHHEKTCTGSDHTCGKCGKRCSTAGGLRRHQESHTGEKRKNKNPAEQRRKKVKRSQALEDMETSAELKNKKIKTIHSSQEPGPSNAYQEPCNDDEPSNHEPTYHCRRCPFTTNNRRDLYLHGMREHFQHGGALHPVPWGDNPAPWVREDGSIDEGLREVYEANAPLILQNHETGPVQSTYNFPVTNDVSVDQLMNYVEEIYNEQQHSFRINFSFGAILQNRETGEYRYFTAYTNNVVLESPMFISRRANLRRLYLQLRRMDILNELLFTRPDTKWVPVLITNIQFFVTSTNYLVGVGNLPDYLMNKQSLYPLVKDQHTRRPYNDHLCLFRCLALHRKYDIKSLEVAAKQYFAEWVKYNKSNKEFCGVAIEEFPDFETCFKVNLEVYSLQEDDSCRSIYKSRGRYDTSLYINLYENHASYIKNFASYAKKYQCKTCERHFKQSIELHRHQKICTNKTKYVYPGGFYQPQETIFNKLDQFNIHVPQDQRTFPWFIVYDFESVLRKVQDQPTEFLQWTEQHVPISVSICSNVESHTEPICFVEENQDKLVQEMLASMMEIAEKVKELSEAKWGWVLEEINKKMEDKKEGIVANMKDGEEDVDGEEKQQKNKFNPLERLFGQFKSYMTQVPVLGFNSARYDLNLIKKTIARHLSLHEANQTFVVKKNNAYTCIASKELKFLDISQFLAPGSSYAQFLKAYKVTEKKGFFPYQWFDAVTKLEETELPSHDKFYSSLRQANISDEEYQYCQKVWVDNNMQTFKNFLVWYNNLDVQPFVTALERLKAFYFDKGIDVFKTAISVPGIARQLLFRTAQEENVNFPLFDQNNADLYQTIRHNVIGGPSIIFNRHHQAGKSRIRGGKLCQKIQGYDANALYLGNLGQALPVGAFVRRLADKGFKAEVRDNFMSAYYWMDWLKHTQGFNILHKINHGSEVRVGKYPVDGYRAATHAQEKPTVYQFHGCYFHGHQCEVTRNIKDQKWWDSREAKFKKTQEITEYLKNQNCTVVEMYECEFKQYCRSNPSIYQFMNKHRPTFYQKHRGAVGENQILEAVLDGSLFGMVEVDIRVPKEWPTYFSHHTMTPYEYFQEMSPLFCTTDVPYDAMGEHMQEHVETHNLSKASRRLLVGGMSAQKILLATPLLAWYLRHGMVVSRIYQVVEFQQARCFKKFVQEVSDCRRKGDLDVDTVIIAETMKVIGNSGYGSLIMDKTKHRQIKYVQGENKTCLKVNDPLFRKLDCLDPTEQYYEVEMSKKKIKLDLSIQLGYFILQYAKLRMLQFYYDFMDKYVDRSDFEYCEMDTDSAYMAISGSSLEDVIKPGMKKQYQHGLKGFCTDAPIEADANYHWFPRTCCTKHAEYDKRTPGLFKLEYQGDEMIGLCSKTYIVRKSKILRPSTTSQVAYKLLRKAKKLKPKRLQFKAKTSNEYKFSSKGVSKRNIKAPMSIFRNVLCSRNSRSGTNRGFRVRNNTIYTYTQIRRGFSYFYCKRRVLDDGIHTVPLDLTLCPIPKTKQQDDVDGDDEVRDALVGLLDEQ